MRSLTTICFVLFVSLEAAKGFSPPANSAKVLAYSGASAGINDIFAIHNNVGNLSWLKNNTLGTTVQNNYGISDYSSLFVAGSYKIKETTIAASLNHQFLSSVAEDRLQMAVSQKLLENLSFGVGLNYHIFNVANDAYSAIKIPTFNAGLSYIVSEKIQIGASVFNPNRTMLNTTLLEKSKASSRLGMAFRVEKKLMWYTDAVLTSDQKLNFQNGLDYQYEQLSFRAGFATLNNQLSFGLGYESKKLNIDVGLQYHNQLGFSPALSLQYGF